MSEPLDALEQAWRASGSPEAGAAYIAALVARVAGAPTDTRSRLRLGRALHDQGEIHGAIPELQKAKVDPATRPEAGYYLGSCFVKMRMAKLALNELSAVIAGAPQPLEGVAKDAADLVGRIHEQAAKKSEVDDAYRLINAFRLNSPDASGPQEGGTTGPLAPLRPGDPPRRPPDPPSAMA